MHRVQKLLSNYGYCSRDKAEILIKQGRVKVNKKPITIGDKASEKDDIHVDDKLVKPEKKVYLMFNKPLGCVTAINDKFYKTVMDYIKIKERVFPVGRLDKNTTGLLLLTNDGDFANRIMHPRYEVKKTYRVGLYNQIDSEKIRMIEKGIILEDGKTNPAIVDKISLNLIDITIHEGKNRIVRRMIEAIGLKVRSLERTRIGNLGLDIMPGRYRNLRKGEKDLLFQQPKRLK